MQKSPKTPYMAQKSSLRNLAPEGPIFISGPDKQKPSPEVVRLGQNPS